MEIAIAFNPEKVSHFRKYKVLYDYDGSSHESGFDPNTGEYDEMKAFLIEVKEDQDTQWRELMTHCKTFVVIIPHEAVFNGIVTSCIEVDGQILEVVVSQI